MDKKGFTLVELLITIIIAVAISAVTFLNYAQKKSNTEMTATAQEAGALVREAESRTIAGDQNGTTGNGFWGVQFTNATNTTPYYSLFYATSTAGVASGTTVGRYTLPTSVSYVTSTIVAGGTLYFYYTSGFVPGAVIGAHETCVGYTCPAGTSTIMIGFYTPRSKPVLSSTVSIIPSGGVSY